MKKIKNQNTKLRDEKEKNVTNPMTIENLINECFLFYMFNFYFKFKFILFNVKFLL